ncbi:MAG: hypothetical protein E7456_06320 [Ruminococcaceae bacterium]|nr:hypothetical protein [Oscillospiraceae bacterium]
MKKAIGILTFILAISCLLSITAFAIDHSGVDYNDVISEERYDRIYNEANYKNEFEPGAVVIYFKKGITEDMNFIELLPEVKIAEIKNTIMVNGRVMVHAGLEEKTRESVLEAIDVLKVTDIVYFAEPNYRIIIDDPNPEIVTGDMNFDARLTNEDIVIMARVIVGSEALRPLQNMFGDANGDGLITNVDLVAAARALVGA